MPLTASRRERVLSAVLLLTTACLAPGLCRAQELTPRAYWPAPNGTQALVLGYAYQTGDIVTDPSLPIAGVDSRLHNVALAYQRTLDLFGRTSNLQFEVPWVTGNTSGQVEGLPQRRDLQGFGDISATLSVNLLGAPSMTRSEFRSFRADPQPILAIGLKVVAPTGEYDSDRLINISTNRWAARARLGYIQPLPKRWALEVSGGAWVFKDNKEFLGHTREQDPIYALDVSLIRRIRPGFWASLDLNFYRGGETSIDGKESANLQRNSRVGFSLVYPVKPLGALRLNYTNGIVTESGGDYDSIGLSWIYLFR